MCFFVYVGFRELKENCTLFKNLLKWHIYCSPTTLKDGFLPACSHWTAVCIAPPTLYPNERGTKIDMAQLSGTLWYLFTVETQTIVHRTVPNRTSLSGNRAIYDRV